MNDTNPEKVAADDLKADSGTDWGEDWESAFQAEDDLFFPDLDEPSSPSPPAPEETAHPKPPPEETAPKSPTPQTSTEPTAIAHAGSLFGLRWLLTGLGGGLILMLTILGIYLLITDAPEPTAINTPLPPAATITAGTKTAIVPLPQSVKVKLKPFLIPVKSEKGAPLREFLELKLTLVLQLDPARKDTLAPKEIILLRDSVYRFFHAITAVDLHRYALARGEMLKKTIQAIRRDRPDLTIKTIIFERYRLT